MATTTHVEALSLSTIDLSPAVDRPIGLDGGRPGGPLPTAQDAARQAAARLALVAGRDRGGLFVVAGIDDRDRSDELAVALATATASLGYGNVLLFDTMAGGHTVESVFRLGTRPGLCDVLTGAVDVSKAATQANGTNLYLMGRGTPLGPLSSLLSHRSGQLHFDSLRHHFRYVFTSLGPLFQDPEALHMAAQTDGVVLALARGARRQHEVVSFRESAERLGLRLLGAVLTERREKA